MSSTDDSEEDGPEFSGIIQPPLIHQLKSILDQYPDDGQILKEIIQNAEDAEASEMKVLFDERCVNKEDGTKRKAFKKYFKGPALCVFNSASFTEADWTGIQMIYQSVKEFDPVKVGRFGLGFKSVFHITDYPMIISGGKLLVIDPHQKDPGKVCITMKLNKLHKYKKQMEPSYCLNAFDGLFGFSQETLDTGNFHGTLFRFPLRHDVSPLSDNIYGREKISDLFTAFQSEASVELLFLKCLEKIELFWKTGDDRRSDDPFFMVKIADNCLADVRIKRSELQSYMRQVLLSVTEETYIRTFDLTIVTQNATEESIEQDWFVMHCRKGKPLSDELIKLSQDESLSYSPYVSVAVPLFVDPQFIGHVFCLMPLPLETKSLTGYPVHVNGLFALDQNRRHVKWPSADQRKNKTHTDKPTRWNKCLVNEVLAHVYHMTIKELLWKCENNQFPQRDVERVYNVIPNLGEITSNWNLIKEPLVERLLETPFLFTSKDGGKWILPSQAVFSILDGSNDLAVEKSVLKLAKNYGIHLVEAPEHIISMLKWHRLTVKTLSKDFIVNCLKNDNSYTSFPFSDKMNILLYLVNGGQYSCLQGLKLLPLHNGSFVGFGEGNRVYVCREEADLFPGQEASFVNRELEENVYTVITYIARQGNFQMSVLEDQPADVIANMVEKTLQLHNGSSSNTTVSWDRTGPVGEAWLRKVWLFIHRFSLSSFSNLHLIPDFRKNVLRKVSEKFLMVSCEGHSLSENISNCLRYLGIAVLDEETDEIIQHKDIRRYVLIPTSDNILSLIALVQSRSSSQQIQTFNSSVIQPERDEFIVYLPKYSLSSSVKELIRSMNLYLETKSGRPVSVRDINRVVHTGTIPVQYFRESLYCPTSDHESLATLLNAQVLQEEDVIIDILINLRNQYDTDDVNRMMNHVLSNLQNYHRKDKIMNIARSIEFVTNTGGQMKCANELYDPDDEILKSVIVDKNSFPDRANLPVEIGLLRNLGLKSWNEISAEDVLRCAQQIQSSTFDHVSQGRSKTLIGLVLKKSNLLQIYINKTKLADLLKNICFVVPRTRGYSYPTCLPWCADNLSFCSPSNMLDVKHTSLIGCTRPIIPESMYSLNGPFGCNQEPLPSDVIDQLLILVSRYEDKHKPELLPMISSIYKFLATKPMHKFKRLTEHKWLWTGNGFEKADRVYLKTKRSDISLVPYLYPLPSEFIDKNLQSFFRRMGCIGEQSSMILKKVQMMVQEKYKKNRKSVEEATADLHLVISIINHLKDVPKAELEGVLIPVKQDDDSKVVLYPVSECNYCRDDDEFYGDEKHFVHQDITSDTAEKLGVPSVMDTLLEDAERLEEWGQCEPLTRRIKTLLESYKDGLSVPKEIIQNADDAGATKVCFMYDERDKDTYGRKLIDKNMLECQGPALWAYNDAVFTDDDLQNITKVSGATKQEDMSKIGKFGLGFCSVYNLTEVPSFVTGNNMVIFDPHYQYLGDALARRKQPGLKVDFTKNRKILERKTSQFEPFNGVFGCDLRRQSHLYFNGTLFRLPLRTRQQALSSEISNTMYDREQMNSLLKIFAEAGGNLLLFTQNVSCVEFYHLNNGENPTDASLVYSVNRKDLQCIERPLSNNEGLNRYSVLKELSAGISNVKNGREKSVLNISQTFLLEISITVGSRLTNFSINGCSSLTTWMVAWASGTEKSRALALQSNRKGVLPLASVACPVEKSETNIYKTRCLQSLPFGYYRTSHVFCYLPLPVETTLPVFINGSFAVTSDRRRLSCKTTDDIESFESEWNEALITDAVCNAYVLFLQRFNSLSVDSDEPYYKKWPVGCAKDGNMEKLQMSFYLSVANKCQTVDIFRRGRQISCFQKCMFLNPSLLDTKFGEDAFNVCVKHLEDVVMMKMPHKIQNCFKNAGCDKQVKQKTLTTINFYSQLVFPYLVDGRWSDEVRDLLILHALDNASGKMCELIKASKCIPTSPNKHLRYPDELVDRNSSIGILFKEEDERFVPLDVSTFSKPSRITTLCNLGMKTKSLPDHLLIERTNSVSSLSLVCSQCALDRCSNLVKYIDAEYRGKRVLAPLLSHLKMNQFLPVVSRPSDWKWQWAGDIVKMASMSPMPKHICNDHSNIKGDIKFESPQNLYSNKVQDLVCAVRPVLDRSKLPLSLYLQFLIEMGVQETVSPALAFDNLTAICETASQSCDLSCDINTINQKIFAVYKHLNSCFEKAKYTDEKKCVLLELAKRYREENIIFLNGSFIRPSQVVIDCSEDCSPHFYRLNSVKDLRSLTGLMNLLQIDEKCSPDRIVKALKTYKNELHDTEVETYVKLLSVLAHTMKTESPSQQNIVGVLIPDERCILRPITEICIDEPMVNSMECLNFTHEKISYEIANAIGVKTKRQQKVEECTKDLYSEDFGQHEELITRIKRILSGYPCDSGILKELVQNADDAKATEVHIVVDFDNHPSENLFDTSWQPLQGPAILVYNNQYFTQADLEGIQKLGLGSKSEDPTKTGQYGVGFNAVYHLTDVPSFLTRGKEVESGEILGVFDPHCKYVPKATARNPGRKYLHTDTLREDHPNVFTCYHDKMLMGEQGTIFRLPLRSGQFVRNSQISNQEITQTFIDKLVDDFKCDMQNMLLFVSHVKLLKISQIRNGGIENIYSVQRDVSNVSDKSISEYNNAVKNASYLQSIGDITNIQTLEILSNIDIIDSTGITQEWLVVRRIGFSGQSACPDNVLQAVRNKDLGLLPRGGVALPICASKCTIQGRVFCFLPLPIETGLPAHFNGHFALDHEARRNLWYDDHENYRTSWNKHLLNDVIAPAYASALLKMKEMRCLKSESQFDQFKLRKDLDLFHSYFPDVVKSNGDYCVFLVHSIYKWITTNELPLFPSALPVSRSKAVLRFFPLTSDNFEYPCVFNTLQKQNINLETTHAVSRRLSERIESFNENTNNCRTTHIPSLIQILKQLGIKLLDSPKHIRKSMQSAEIALKEISPDFVMEFLKSYDSPNQDKCKLQAIDKAVKDTIFNTANNVCLCLQYCMTSEHFKSMIEGLPLCLTQDGILRTFSSGTPVYLSLFSNIVEESTRWFIHEDLYPHLSLDMTGMKSFGIDALADILSYSLNSEKYRTTTRPVPWKLDSNQVPSLHWLENVWFFIDHEINSKQSSNKDAHQLEYETLSQRLSDLLPWCLVPGIQESNTCGESVLYPVKMSKFVLDIQTYSGSLKAVLQRLALPTLDAKVVMRNVVLCKLLASSRNANDLLSFLYEYRNEIRLKSPSVEDCTHILEYFGQHIDDIFKNEENIETVLKKLKELPLHITVDGHNISLEELRSVLVLDESTSKTLIVDGIDDWARYSRTTLLRTTHNLTPLYVKLGYREEKLEAIDVYTDYILPKFHYLPNHAHISHLQYIRDVLLAIGSSFSEKQESLIAVLKNVSFVPDDQGVLYKVSHYKDPFDQLLKEMCDPNSFPAYPFCKMEWHSFLVKAGLQSEIPPCMIVEFAKTVEKQGKICVTEETIKRSEMLVKHILGRSNVENGDLLKTISTIKFVISNKTAPWKTEVFPQYCDSLICYHGSVIPVREDICWTTSSIVTKDALPRDYYTSSVSKKILQQLGVELQPKFICVLNHIQNVCDKLKYLSNTNMLYDSMTKQVENLIIKFYDWIDDNKDVDPEKLTKALAQKPIVFLPDHKLFVTCQRVVRSFDIENESEILPYLIQAPDKYGKYFKVFITLGMTTNTTISNYVRVLYQLKLDIQESNLHANQLQVVQKALKQILYRASKSRDHICKELEEIGDLFLLSREHKLMSAPQLVFSDNADFEDKIGDEIGKPYMMGLEDLDISISGSVSTTLRRLPVSMQPSILSDMISEELDYQSLQKTSDQRGQILRDFFDSSQFREALIRISIHCCRTNKCQKEMEKKQIDELMKGIESLKIVQVESIHIRLTYNGIILGQSDKMSYCRCSEVNGGKEVTLICAFNKLTLNEWIMKNITPLSQTLSTCTNYLFFDLHGYLATVFAYVDNPDGISKALDEAKVHQYSVFNKKQKSVFPPCGTTVAAEWHCYLDNSFSNFEIDDYIALLISEESTENDRFIPAVYIYAKIVEKLDYCSVLPKIGNALRFYKVNVGNGRIEKKAAYDCYKFNCVPSNTSSDLDMFIDIAETAADDRPIDDIKTEIRDTIKAAWTLPEDERKKIIKRLYKIWHPDKNYGNEAMTTEVFKYLLNIVLRMESGEDINANTNSGFDDTPRNSPYWEHFRTWGCDAEADRQYSEQRKNKSGSRGGRRQAREDVPSAAEARQWMKQARTDYRAADKFLPHSDSGPHFNWICLMCYQCAEKVLKALHFNKDSNNVPGSNDLVTLTSGLPSEIGGMVRNLVTVVGPRDRLMYPDRLSVDKIPADDFTKEIAERAKDVTRRILEFGVDML